MGDTVTTSFLIGVNLIIACVIVSLGLFLTNSGKSLASTFSNKLASVNSNISDADVLMYDGVTVKGSDVVSCIKKHLSDLDITVNKLGGSDAVNATWLQCKVNDTFGSSSFVNLPEYAREDVSGVNTDGRVYINPNADFKGSVTRNANGAVVGITFDQVAYRSDAYEVPQTGNTTIVISNGVNGDSSMQEAIATLNSATQGLGEAINNLQQSGGVGISEEIVGTLSAMQTTLATLSSDVQSLQGISGVDTGLGDNISSLKVKIDSMYELIANSSASGGKTENDTDDVFQEVTNANEYLTQVAADVTTIKQQLLDIKSQISGVSSQISTAASTLSAEHSAITALLNQIIANQATQDQKLDSIANSVSTQSDTLQKTQTKLAATQDELKVANRIISSQDDQISSLYSTIASLQAQLDKANSGKKSTATVGDLQNYAAMQAVQAEKAQNLNTTYAQFTANFDSFSKDMDTLYEWLEKQPGVEL